MSSRGRWLSGICGIYSPAKPELASRERLESMLEAIAHRGGCEKRIFIDREAGIAMGIVVAPTFQRPERPARQNWFEDKEYVAALDGALFERSPGSLAGETRPLVRDIRATRGGEPEALNTGNVARGPSAAAQ